MQPDHQADDVSQELRRKEELRRCVVVLEDAFEVLHQRDQPRIVAHAYDRVRPGHPQLGEERLQLVSDRVKPVHGPRPLQGGAVRVGHLRRNDHEITRVDVEAAPVEFAPAEAAHAVLEYALAHALGPIDPMMLGVGKETDVGWGAALEAGDAIVRCRARGLAETTHRRGRLCTAVCR